jgi:HEAT repeat protein
MKRGSIGALFLATACARDALAPPPFELRPVVRPAIEALLARAGEPPAAPPADAELRERVESILGPLRGGDARLRALAIEDARGLPEGGVDLLAAALRDPAEPDAARAALAEALGALATPRALAALEERLAASAEPWLRAQCAYRLGGSGRDTVVPPLLARLKYEKDHEVVYWIADALARFDHLAGADGLFVLWSEGSSEELRARAGALLSELANAHGAADASALLRRWNDGTLAPSFVPSPELELEGWRWIERLGEWNLRFVDDARFVLSRLEGWIVPMLATVLHEEEVYVRLHAAQCLERRGRRGIGAAGELLAALAEPRIAPEAAAALGALGHVPAARELERVLDHSGDIELRVAAALALGRLGQTSSEPALQRAFDPAQPLDLRQAAAQAILNVASSKTALAFLADCLEDPRADGGAAEVALEAWLVGNAGQEPATLERWRALALDPERIPSDEEQRQRLRGRAALARELAR